MLRIGIVGYGSRLSQLAKELGVYKIPYKVSAIAGPRTERIQQRDDGFLDGTRYYEDTASMLNNEADRLDGIMIGTRCNLHAEIACKAAATELPIFLEKPVAITFEQIQQLAAAYVDYPAPTVVSFPLRLSPIVQRVKEIVDSGQIGSVENMVSWCTCLMPQLTIRHGIVTTKRTAGSFCRRQLTI